jgi:hypothetical protein
MSEEKGFLTRVECSRQVWLSFRALGVERGLRASELLGSVVTGYVVRQKKRRPRLVVEKEKAS